MRGTSASPVARDVDEVLSALDDAHDAVETLVTALPHIPTTATLADLGALWRLHDILGNRISELTQLSTDLHRTMVALDVERANPVA